MSNKEKLSASHIRYLFALLKINNESEGMRCTDISNAVGYSKPSVNFMMNHFIEEGFIYRKHNGNFAFTEKGKKTALKYK